jgi:signal transduction histidine kinase/FixJ family two-component response regulator
MTSQRSTILVVADDVARGDGVAKCIARGDPTADVLRVSTAEAVARVDEVKPHVVLIAGDGDLVRALREHAAELPIVVMMLSDTRATQGTRALDEGATDVIMESELEPRLLVWRLHLAARHHESERKLREAKELAESASARKTEFLSSMSHEIRTPLNTMVGMAELLDETDLDDRQRRYVDTLQRASDHVLALVENVLDLARVEAGSVTLEESGFDLYEVAESATDLVRMQARRKKLDLGWSAEPNVPRELRGDPRRVRQVLVNLLTNAIKFTGQGRVWLTISRDDRGEDSSCVGLHFAVTDTGVGIPQNKLEAIFDGFVQVDEPAQGGTLRTTAARGFGLGLNITRRILARMGGRAWAESTLGKGSTFHATVTLPTERGVVGQTFESREANKAAPLKLRAPGDRAVRVLVVDDSEDNRVLLGEYLRGAGVEVDYADDGPSALAKGVAQPFDVVLMDLQLPNLDGYATTRELLRLVRERNIRPPAIIALSAHVLAESFSKSMEAGCTTQLTKPIRKRALLEAVAQAAGARTVETHEASSTAAKGPLREEILPLLPKFFANRRADVRIIREALDKNDLTTIATLAHNMRGTGASYGFPEITTLGEALQTAGKRGSMVDAKNLASELEVMLDRLEARYSEIAATAATAQQKKIAAMPRTRVQSPANDGVGDKH